MIARIRPETRYAHLCQSLFAGAEYKNMLENELKAYFGVEEVLLTQGGRVGLHYLLKALPHKKVYLPAYTCWAVPEAVNYAQKELAYVDISLQDFNMDVEKLRESLTPGSIILATHQFGIPCDIEKYAEIAKTYDSLLLEDNAAGFGSTYKGQKTGSFGAASIISFEFSKTLTCGKGGAILFNDRDLYRKVKKIYSEEVKQARYVDGLKNILYLLGYKAATQKLLFNITHFLFIKTKGLTTGYPRHDASAMSDAYLGDLDNVRARLALSGLLEIEQVLKRRKEVAEFYLRELAACEKVEMPVYPQYKSPILIRFPFRVKNGKKEDFYAQCARHGLDLAFTFSYSCAPDRVKYPRSCKAAETVLNLPIYSGLSDQDLQVIKKVLTKI